MGVYPFFLFLALVQQSHLFSHPFSRDFATNYRQATGRALSIGENGRDEPSSLLTSRLPTSVEDQVRQTVYSIQQNQNHRRHTVRLLLPLIGATDLDDWPGGARQMMEAAAPLAKSILQGLDCNESVEKFCIDESDGVYAWLAQASEPKNDCVVVLLPTAECVNPAIRQTLEAQVGPNRNMILVNPQWRRRTDFGGFLQLVGQDDATNYVESYRPTFSLTNMICEGESIRVLHTYGQDWRVYLREEVSPAEVDWTLVGTMPYQNEKPDDWDKRPENRKDGGKLFDYGQPTYQEIYEMLLQAPDYKPKSPAERAAAAFSFIKDTL